MAATSLELINIILLKLEGGNSPPKISKCFELLFIMWPMKSCRNFWLCRVDIRVMVSLKSIC